MRISTKGIILAACAILLMASGVSAQNTATKQLNKKNLVIKEWNTASGSSKRILDHQTVYNSDGQKIEEKEFTTTGLKWTKRFEYGANGKVAKELVYNERNKLVSIKKIEWNEFDRKKVQYTYDPKGRLVSTKTFEYLAGDE
ncbi:MAG: hypothetical protein K6C31_06395 [Bacteroidales bacterium]|jgi:YD repeat-containing protein|nr:hypothetical protein [Bacteroidales bacterium]